MWFCNFWAAVSAFALLSCSTVHVDALFPFNCVIEWMNEWMNENRHFRPLSTDCIASLHCQSLRLHLTNVSHRCIYLIDRHWPWVWCRTRRPSARTGTSAAMSSRSTPLMHAAKYRSLSTNCRTRTCRSGVISHGSRRRDDAVQAVTADDEYDTFSLTHSQLRQLARDLTRDCDWSHLQWSRFQKHHDYGMKRSCNH